MTLGELYEQIGQILRTAPHRDLAPCYVTDSIEANEADICEPIDMVIDQQGVVYFVAPSLWDPSGMFELADPSKADAPPESTPEPEPRCAVCGFLRGHDYHKTSGPHPMHEFKAKAAEDEAINEAFGDPPAKSEA